MAIFRRRPLAFASVALIAGTVLSFFLPFKALWIVLMPLAALFVLCLVLSLINRRSYPKLLLCLLSLFLLLGAGRVFLDRHRMKTVFDARLGTTVEATFTVEQIYTRNTYGSAFLAQLTALDGEDCRAHILFVTEDLSPFYLGDCVSGRFLCENLQTYCYYTGQEKQYLADGVCAALSLAEGTCPTLVSDGSGSARAKLADLRGILHHRMTQLVNGDGGELIAAMLFGMRESLDDGVEMSFRRLGVSHLLAISGLHLAILIGIIDRLLRWVRVGKHFRISLLLIFCGGYLILTGCSASILRAVFMMTVLQLSFFVKGDYDAFTALCFCGALMVLAAPATVFDLSFQMTMLATFGILAFGEVQGFLTRRFPKKAGMTGLLLTICRSVISSVFVTFCATLAILPIQWLVFGELSWLTPLSNLLMVPLATVILFLGVLLLPIFFLPAAEFLAVAIGWVSELMVAVSNRLSVLPSMISLRYGFVIYLMIFFIVVTVLFLILDLKKWRCLTFAPAVLSVIAFAICLCVSHQSGKEELHLIYRNTGKNEGLLLSQNGEVMICDISNGSYTQLQNDYKLLQENCATEVSVLMLTHYHQRQPNALKRFANTVLLRTLWLPAPVTEEDKMILSNLLSIAAERQIAVTIYDYNMPLQIFETGCITMSQPLYESRSVEPAFSLRVSFGNTVLQYQSAAYGEYVAAAGMTMAPTAQRYVIVGGHGPVPHASISLLLLNIPDEIVLSNEESILQFYPSFDTKYVILPEIRKYLLQ